MRQRGLAIIGQASHFLPHCRLQFFEGRNGPGAVWLIAYIAWTFWWWAHKDSNLGPAEKVSCSNFGLDYFTDVPAPTIQRLLALSQKVVPLINGRHSRNSPRLMVEDLVGDMRGNAQSRHSRNDRASQIMKSPTSDTAKSVDGSLSPSELLKPLSPCRAKNVRFARAGLDYLPSRFR